MRNKEVHMECDRDCGAEHPKGAKFCIRCGGQLKVKGVPVVGESAGEGTYQVDFSPRVIGKGPSATTIQVEPVTLSAVRFEVVSALAPKILVDGKPIGGKVTLLTLEHKADTFSLLCRNCSLVVSDEEGVCVGCGANSWAKRGDIPGGDPIVKSFEGQVWEF